MTMDLVYYCEERFDHYDHYEEVPWAVIKQFLGGNNNYDPTGRWTRKIFINGEEVSE